MNIEMSVKNVLIIGGVISAISGNIFVLGKVFSDFELLKTEIQAIKDDQNVLELQQVILTMYAISIIGGTIILIIQN